MVTWAVLERGEERRGGEGEYLGSFCMYGWDGKGREGGGLGYGILELGWDGGSRWIGLDRIGEDITQALVRDGKNLRQTCICMSLDCSSN